MSYSSQALTNYLQNGPERIEPRNRGRTACEIRQSFQDDLDKAEGDAKAARARVRRALKALRDFDK